MKIIRKKYKDPIYNWIFLNVDKIELFSKSKVSKINEAILQIVQSHAFKRLRDIKQLGHLYWVFPGATHTRFLHSIGVFHLAKIALQNENLNWLKKEALLFLFAALLHDIGHGPLSHSFEQLLDTNGETGIKWHEQRTWQIIKNDRSINSILQKVEKWLPIALIELFQGKKISEFSNSDNSTAKVRKMISSQFDIDRLDYLQRDAFFCGTKYVFGEGELLLSALKFDVEEEKLYFSPRYENTVLYYLLTRIQMREAVYFHKDSVFFDSLLFFLGKLIKTKNILINELTNMILTNDFNVNNIEDFTDEWIRNQLRGIFLQINKNENNGDLKVISLLINAYINSDFKNIDYKVQSCNKLVGTKKDFEFITTKTSFRFSRLISAPSWCDKVNSIFIKRDGVFNEIKIDYLDKDYLYKNTKKITIWVYI